MNSIPLDLIAFVKTPWGSLALFSILFPVLTVGLRIVPTPPRVRNRVVLIASIGCSLVFYLIYRLSHVIDMRFANLLALPILAGALASFWFLNLANVEQEPANEFFGQFAAPIFFYLITLVISLVAVHFMGCMRLGC
jgi:hypothetical protein